MTQADLPGRQGPFGDKNAKAQGVAWLTHTEGTGPEVLGAMQ